MYELTYGEAKDTPMYYLHCGNYPLTSYQASAQLTERSIVWICKCWGCAYTSCLIIRFSAILNACLGAKLPIVVSPCYNAESSCLGVNAIVELEDNTMKLQSNCEQWAIIKGHRRCCRGFSSQPTTSEYSDNNIEITSRAKASITVIGWDKLLVITPFHLGGRIKTWPNTSSITTFRKKKMLPTWSLWKQFNLDSTKARIYADFKALKVCRQVQPT